MRLNRSFSAALLLALAAVLAACNAPVAPTADSNAILTRAAGTAAARLTEAAALQPSATATVTLAPTHTPAPPTPTLEPSPTPPPAAETPTVTATTAPPAASSADAAGYIADVDYPDNSPVAPGEVFTKTWRIKNTGTTTWTTAYSLVCIDPGKFQCPEATPLPKEVKPGETVDIQVRLTAPTQTGTQRAFFRLRNAAGQFFKLDGSGDLWVQVIVGDSNTVTKPGGTPTVTVTPGGPTFTPQPTATLTNTPEPTVTPTP